MSQRPDPLDQKLNEILYKIIKLEEKIRSIESRVEYIEELYVKLVKVMIYGILALLLTIIGSSDSVLSIMRDVIFNE